MVPLSTEVALDVKEIWIQGFHANAQSFPLSKARRECFGERAISSSREVGCLVCYLDFVVLLDSVDLALCYDRVCEDFVEVLAWEHLVLPDILQVFVRNAKFTQV
jgi:hypothetical protein